MFSMVLTLLLKGWSVNPIVNNEVSGSKLSQFIRTGGVSHCKLFFYRVTLKRFRLPSGKRQVVLIELGTYCTVVSPKLVSAESNEKMTLASFVEVSIQCVIRFSKLYYGGLVLRLGISSVRNLYAVVELFSYRDAALSTRFVCMRWVYAGPLSLSLWAGFLYRTTYAIFLITDSTYELDINNMLIEQYAIDWLAIVGML